nr:ribonuclease H-like domain, reverse transcriptase, RNA-dependent DNA polymerase [Tanacetum cinerariifolium]
MDACAALTRRVEHLEYDKVSQALDITKLKRRLKKLEKRNKVRVLKLRRLQRVGTSHMVETFNDTVMDDESNQGRMIAEIDQDDAVVLKDDKEENKEVVDVVKDVEEAKVDESAPDKGRQAESQAEIYKIDIDHANKVLSMQEDETKLAEVQEVVDVVTTSKLITKVVITASETVTTVSAIITTAEAQVPAATLTISPARDAVALSKRRKEVVIRHPESESTTSTIIPAETKSKDKGKGILNVAGFKMDYFKGMSCDDIRLIFEAKFNSNVAFLLKTKEQIEEDENRALQKLNETPAERVAKRRKLDEEVEELRRHLQIVPNEDVDVYTEATPLAQKVPIVDYQVIEMNNKPYYKIIRADDTHQSYVSFLSLLRYFDREDLEALWSLVKEIFSTTKPKNFSDDFLLVTLEAMLEKPDIHAQIWKTQKNEHGPAKVKGWKLLESCEDMQRKKNDVKARTTLLLSLLDEHQLRFEGSESLEQTFNRLQVIVGQLQFMDVEVEQDDLNQKFLTSLSPEWLMHTIVWRNRSDLDTISLDDFINKDENTACVSIASTIFPTASASVASISQDTAYAYIASQSSGSQIKFEDINQIDEDDMEKMDIKWSMALLSMRAYKFWKKTRKKISIQGSDVAGFDKSKGSKVDEQTPKALMAIDGVGWDWSYMANEGEDHALTGLPECADDTVTDYSRPSPIVESTLEDDQNRNSSASEDVASPILPKPFVKFVKPKDCQSESKTDKKETPKKPAVKYAEQYRKSNKKRVKGGHLGLKIMLLRALHTDLLVTDHMILQNNPHVNRKFSTGSRNFPTANRKFPTASRKFPTGGAKIHTADMGRKGKAIKPSACWIWKPTQYLSNKGPNNNSVSVMFKKYTYIDTQGRLKHMTGNISYLSDFEPFDGGYVSFGQGGCKITGKGTIKTGCACHVRLCQRKNNYLYFVCEYNVDFHIRQFWSTARIETTEEGTQILATMDGIHRTVTESSLRRNLKLRDEDGISSLPDTELFENLTLMGYNISQNQKFTFQKGQFSHQWKYLIHTIMKCLSPKSTGFNEFSSNIATALVCLATNRTYNFSKMIFDGLVKNVSNKISKFIMYPRFLMICLRMIQFGQITHTHQYVGEGSGTPTEPHPIPSPEADPTFHTTLSISLPSVPTAPILTVTHTETTHIRQYTRRARITQSSALPPVADEPASPVRDVRRSIDEGEAATKRISDDTEEIAMVLTSMDATTVLAGGIDDVPTGSGSIPTIGPPAADIPTSSDVVPTASPVFATATMVTPYSRRKGKEVMVEPDTLKKQRLQEQIGAQVARELEEQQEREDKRMTEQIARDAEVVRIHAEEELQIMIDGLDRSNEVISKHLAEYDQTTADLTIGERIELINELVKYQDYHAKILQYQSQQKKPKTKKQKRDFYMAVIRNNLGWKVKDFKGMTFEEMEAKFNSACKQIEDFTLMGSKEEAERIKRKGINLEQESEKKLNSSEEVIEEAKSTAEIPEEKIKEMMQLIPIEEVYVEALQHLDRDDLNQLWALVKEYLSIRPVSSDKEIELWVELKRLNCQRQRDLHASREGLSSKEGSGHCYDKGRIVRNKMNKAFPLPELKIHKQQIELDKQYARELHVKLNKYIDWDEAIDHVKRKAKEDPAVKRYQVLKRKPQTKAQARKNMIMYLKNVVGFKMDYFKGISYDEIRPIFEAKFNSNVAFLLKTKEQIEEDENKALQKLNETPTERASKRRKLDEEVIEMNNKPYYKIIRANDTHQLYPKNFSNDFLLVTLGAMFKKPDIHAQIWKTQRNEHGPTKVKGWKLLESCGVQIITFTSTQLILLVERKYSLTRFTLDQMLNVLRLEVEEESEVSLKLLRFTRQQHQEGQLE